MAVVRFLFTEGMRCYRREGRREAAVMFVCQQAIASYGIVSVGRADLISKPSIS
jgi:hypothetical protein